MNGGTDFNHITHPNDSRGGNTREAQIIQNRPVTGEDRKPTLPDPLKLGKNEDGYDILPSK